MSFEYPHPDDAPSLHPEVDDPETVMDPLETTVQGLLDAMEEKIGGMPLERVPISDGKYVEQQYGGLSNGLLICLYKNSPEGSVAEIDTETIREPGAPLSGPFTIKGHIVRQTKTGLKIFDTSRTISGGFSMIDPAPEDVLPLALKALAELEEQAAAAAFARDVGFDFVSERDVKELTAKVIEGELQQPPLSPMEKWQALKAERRAVLDAEYAARIAGKTALDEAELADVDLAWFLAHGTDDAMTNLKQDWHDRWTLPNLHQSAVENTERLTAALEQAWKEGARSLAEIYGEDSPEAMREQGWDYAGNISPAEIAILAGGYDEADVTTGPAYNPGLWAMPNEPRRQEDDWVAVYVRNGAQPADENHSS